MGLKLRKPEILHGLYYVNKCFYGGELVISRKLSFSQSTI